MERESLENISAYIPTNLISITDGQIYLLPSLFELGVLKAAAEIPAEISERLDIAREIVHISNTPEPGIGADP